VKVERERPAAGPIVLGFGAAGFRTDAGSFSALLLTPERAQAWAPPPLDALDAHALATILEPAPEFVLLGTGAALRPAPPALVRALDARGLGVETMDSRAAARLWGVLRGEGRMLAAALYPLDA
jgi:uncharacterized protein